MPSSLISNADTSTYVASGSSFGLFRGIVVENRDPEKLCRIRVQIPAMTGHGRSGISSESLPWAMPCFPTAGPGYGMAIVPDVGSVVWVAFESGDKTKPVWMGCCYGASTSDGYRQLRSESEDCFKLSDNYYTWKQKEADTPAEYRSHNGNVKLIYHSPKGASIFVNEEDENESFEIIDRLGQTIKFYCPSRSEYNEDNQSARMAGSVADQWEYTDKILPANTGDAYIIIQQASPNPYNDAVIKLSTQETFISNGEMCYYSKGKVTKIMDVEEEQQIINDREKNYMAFTNYTFYPNELHEKRKEKRDGVLNEYTPDEAGPEADIEHGGDDAIYIKKEVSLKITKDGVEQIVQTYGEREKKLERTFKFGDESEDSISTEPVDEDDKSTKVTKSSQTIDDKQSNIKEKDPDTKELLKETTNSQTNTSSGFNVNNVVEDKVTDYVQDQNKFSNEVNDKGQQKTSSITQGSDSFRNSVQDKREQKNTSSVQNPTSFTNDVTNEATSEHTSTSQTSNNYNVDNNGSTSLDMQKESMGLTSTSTSVNSSDTSISGNANVGGNHSVSGTTSLQSSTSIGGSLGVSGFASFAGGVSLAGGGGSSGSGGGITFPDTIEVKGDVIADGISLVHHVHEFPDDEEPEKTKEPYKDTGGEESEEGVE